LWDPVAGEPHIVEQNSWGVPGFSPDGELLARAQLDGVMLFDMKSVQRVGLLRGHQGEVRALTFSPDGRILATASWDRTAKLWDLKTLSELATVGGDDDSVYDVAFSADGERLVTISANGAAKVWDVAAVLGRNLFRRSSNRNS